MYSNRYGCHLLHSLHSLLFFPFNQHMYQPEPSIGCVSLMFHCFCLYPTPDFLKLSLFDLINCSFPQLACVFWFLLCSHNFLFLFPNYQLHIFLTTKTNSLFQVKVYVRCLPVHRWSRCVVLRC